MSALQKQGNRAVHCRGLIEHLLSIFGMYQMWRPVLRTAQNSSESCIKPRVIAFEQLHGALIHSERPRVYMLCASG